MATNSSFRARYFNRELSWIRFNERVLEEAEDNTHPLLERLRFLTIFSTNLDEFFMIRVAGVKDQIDAKIFERSPGGLTPIEVLHGIAAELHPLIDRHSDLITHDILPKLAEEGVHIKKYATLKKAQKDQLAKYFREMLFPVLTPLAVDSAHPMPKLRGLGINLMVELQPANNGGVTKIAVVPVPLSFPRFMHFKTTQRTFDFVPIEDIIEEHIGTLFPSMKIKHVWKFRLTRNADLDISEAEADDLLKLIERELRKRRLGTVIRLEVSNTLSERNCALLLDTFDLENCDIYRVKSFLDTSRFRQLIDVIDIPGLKYAPFTPALHPVVSKSKDIFEAIRAGDILLHQPYDSYNPVVEFLQKAAKDPKVIAIKQTLYRTSGKSPIVMALKEAAENGKQVTALIELKARFDEEANITWARELEEAGVNVIYGILGLKTHCKVAFVLREEAERIQPYVHLSTGNYNEKTAQLYTDLSYFTANAQIGEDIAELFNLLTGYSNQEEWRKILVAPINMRDMFKDYIRECIAHHTPENPSSIKLVMNSLVDPEMIRELYLASNQGVKIDLVIRGICCLIPGVEGMSQNITVKSIVGRFLEHLRVYAFHYNGTTKVYSGSADWMQRNLNRRIEVAFAIEPPAIQQEILEIVEIMLNDTRKARVLLSDGKYIRPESSDPEKELSAQSYFLTRARARQKNIDTIF